MSIFIRAIAISVATISFFFATSAFAETTIVIIRHGEKPEQGLGQLSCQGLNRALALPSVLLSRYGNPSAIYAPNPAVKKIDKGIPYAYIRPLATIEPLAIRIGLPVNIDLGMAEISQLSDQLIKHVDGTFIVAWEHHLAEKLARHILTELGEKSEQVPEWGNADFDSIFVIHIDKSNLNKPHVTFAHEHQELNNLSATCEK
jgi:hypothetical protein